MMLTHLLIWKDKNMKPWFLAILNMHEHLDKKHVQGGAPRVRAHPRCGRTTPGSYDPPLLGMCSLNQSRQKSLGIAVRWSGFLHGRGQSTYKSHAMPLLLFTSFTTKAKHSSPKISWPATLVRSTLVRALHMLTVVNVNHKQSIHPT